MRGLSKLVAGLSMSGVEVIVVQLAKGGESSVSIAFFRIAFLSIEAKSNISIPLAPQKSSPEI